MQNESPLKKNLHKKIILQVFVKKHYLNEMQTKLHWKVCSNMQSPILHYMKTGAYHIMRNIKL